MLQQLDTFISLSKLNSCIRPYFLYSSCTFIMVEFFNMSSKHSCFPDCWKILFADLLNICVCYFLFFTKRQPLNNYLKYFLLWLTCSICSRDIVPPQLFLVVWIFPMSLAVLCYDRWVLREGHKNYFKDWCPSHFSLFDLFLSEWNGHIIKRM